MKCIQHVCVCLLVISCYSKSQSKFSWMTQIFSLVPQSLQYCLLQVLTNQSAAVSLTSPAGMGSVSLSVWCVMIKALTTVGMEVTWKKT